MENGGESEVTLHISVPDELSEGNYTVMVRANAGLASDELSIIMDAKEEQGGEGSFTSEYPSQEGTSGTSFSFSTDLINNGLTTRSYSLSSSAPSGWTVRFSLAASLIANLVYSLQGYVTVGRVLDNYEAQLMINRISPYYLYSDAVSTIMDPTVRSMNILLPQQLDRAVVGYLSAGQSLLLVWPHFVGLMAESAAAFGASYMAFMRREVRSR